MPSSLNARRIYKALDETPMRREEFIGWFEEFSHTLPEAEREEIRYLLWPDEAKRPLHEVPFRELVPEGWFADLLRLVADAEAPSQFYFLAGLCVFGTMLGRKVMIDRGNHTLGIEPSAMLISPAGRARRSTACDFVVYEIAGPTGMPLLADSFTYEAMGDELRRIEHETGEARALVYAGEMSTLIGKQSYGESIIPKLTDLITKTKPFHWGTVKRGQVVLQKPCVNALMTSAPDWLIDNIPAVVFGGGLMSRLLVCVQERPERVVTWGKPVAEGRKESVRKALIKLTGRKGTFHKPRGTAWDWYNDWYHTNARRIVSGDMPDERMAPYFARKHDHLLRVAGMLTLAADEDFTWQVKRLEQALRILDHLETEIPKAYAAMALAPMAAAQQQVIRVLKRNNNSLDHSRLMKACHRQAPMASQFKEVIASLVEMNVLQVSRGIGKGRIYILKEEL